MLSNRRKREKGEGKGGHGLYTYFMLKGLKGEEDVNGDGRIIQLHQAQYEAHRKKSLQQRAVPANDCTEGEAKDIATRKEKTRIGEKLKYFDPENVQLVEAKLVDEVSNEKFAVFKAVEGPAVAYVPKPVVKETSIADIHEIPDFKSESRPNDLAVVIGIENYQGLPKSDYSKSDAGIVKDYLKALGFQERNIEFITDKHFLSGKRTWHIYLLFSQGIKGREENPFRNI